MADVVRKVDYYYALLRDEVGTGARVLAGLDAYKVDLLGFSGFPPGAAFSWFSFPGSRKISSRLRER